MLLGVQQLSQLKGKESALLGPVCTSLNNKDGPKSAVSVPKKAVAKPAAIDRKIEMLVLPGRQSNEGLINFQMANLKSVIGKEINITIHEADRNWTYKEQHDLHDADDMTRALSKGKPFKTWFDIESDDKRIRPYMWKFYDPSVKISYTKKDADNEIDKLIERTKGGDFDIVCGMFEGTIVMHMAQAKLLGQGQKAGWKQSVFFGAMPIRDDAYLGALKAGVVKDHPALFVFGKGDQDYFYQRTEQSARRPAEEYYSVTTVMTHQQAHLLPSDKPRSTEIYERFLAEAKYVCGQGPKPAALPLPPRPTSFPCLDYAGMMPRKLRVLSLCGGHACEPTNKIQTATLKNRLGKDVEWTYLAGGKEWEWYDGEPTPSEMEKMIAGKNPLMNWYLDTAHEKGTGRLNRDKQFDIDIDVEFHDCQEQIDRLEKFINENGPFDVVVGFSQGCIMLHMLIAQLRTRKLKDNLDPNDPMNMARNRWECSVNTPEVMPWRTTIFVAGMHIRDKRWSSKFVDNATPAKHPVVFINGKADEYYDYGKDGFGSKSQLDYYENPLILDHTQSHEFPTQQPRANQIYDAVIDHIWYHCGGKMEETLPTPPSATNTGGKQDLKSLIGPQRPPPM